MPKRAGAPTVRVAHEALITRWARARDFVQDNAEALKIRRRIEERYALWRGLKETGRDAASKGKSEATLRARFAAWRARPGREPGLLSDLDLIDGQRLLREHRADTEPISLITSSARRPTTSAYAVARFACWRSSPAS